MVTFNLMAWRKRKKEYEIKSMKKILFGSLCCAVMLFLLAHFMATFAINAINKRVSKMEDQLQLMMLEKQIPVADENSNMSVEQIKKLHAYRLSGKNLMMALTKTNRKTVCFSEMTRAKNHIYFNGYAHSTADLTEYLKDWPAAPLFSEMNIESLQQDSSQGRIQFRFHALENQSF